MAWKWVKNQRERLRIGPPQSRSLAPNVIPSPGSFLHKHPIWKLNFQQHLRFLKAINLPCGRQEHASASNNQRRRGSISSARGPGSRHYRPYCGASSPQMRTASSAWTKRSIHPAPVSYDPYSFVVNLCFLFLSDTCFISPFFHRPLPSALFVS